MRPGVCTASSRHFAIAESALAFPTQTWGYHNTIFARLVPLFCAPLSHHTPRLLASVRSQCQTQLGCMLPALTLAAILPRTMNTIVVHYCANAYRCCAGRCFHLVVTAVRRYSVRASECSSASWQDVTYTLACAHSSHIQTHCPCNA
jgi:hypothetical protein